MIPNSPLVKRGDTVYIGGTPPLDESGALIGANDVYSQTLAVIDRMASLLTTAGCGLEDLAFITVYLSSLEDYDEMNRAYAEALPPPFPARKVVQSAHTIDGMLVEMTAVASTAPRESPAS